jgi:drug/metabolite transporter (DMT)-like permease
MPSSPETDITVKDTNAGKAFLSALLAVLFWSTSPTAFKLGLRYQDPLALLTGASVVSTLVLGLILLTGKRYRALGSFTGRDLVSSVLLGMLNPVVYYLVLFKAYSLLPAQVAQPLNMVWPIVLVLISIPFMGQKIGWRSLAAMGLSFSGVVVVSLQGGTAGKAPGNMLGIVLALSTSVLWSFYWIGNARDRKDPVARLFLNFLFASLLLVAVGFIRGNPFAGSLAGLAAAAYVGIFEMGVTFVLWLRAMQLAPATDRIGNLVYIAPFLNLLIVNRVLDEKIYLTTVPGILLLVAGILVQNLARHGKRSR